MKRMAKDYFPNNWKRIKDAPDEVFKSCTWDDFHDWRLCSWDLPESVACIIRVSKIDSGKVTEYVYKSGKHASNKIQQLCTDPNNEITIADDEEIHLLRAVPFGDDDDGDDEC